MGSKTSKELTEELNHQESEDIAQLSHIRDMYDYIVQNEPKGNLVRQFADLTCNRIVFLEKENKKLLSRLDELRNRSSK